MLDSSRPRRATCSRGGRGGVGQQWRCRWSGRSGWRERLHAREDRQEEQIEAGPSRARSSRRPVLRVVRGCGRVEGRDGKVRVARCCQRRGDDVAAAVTRRGGRAGRRADRDRRAPGSASTRPCAWPCRTPTWSRRVGRVLRRGRRRHVAGRGRRTPGSASGASPTTSPTVRGLGARVGIVEPRNRLHSPDVRGAARRQHGRRVPVPRHRRRKAAPRVPAALGAILRVMASRVTSTRFVGRDAELEELRGALAEAVGGRPSLAFVAGESGVGKTRLLSELERAARADGMRVIGGDCVELGEGELPYAPIVGALRPLARAGDPAFAALSDAARGALAQILPGLGARRRADDEATAQARLFDGAARAAGAARGRGRAAGHDRGPALGRPLDARVPRLPRELAVPRARARRHHLPPGRAAPPPPAAPAAGRARARRPRPPRRAAARSRARSSAQQLDRHPRRGARATTCSTRLFARSRGQPAVRRGAAGGRARTAAARCRRRCATR